MGYWRQDSEGHSLILEETGMVWGDAPADIMNDALEKVVEVFLRDIGRKPTEEELIGGLKFSIGDLLDEDSQ